MIVLRDRLIVSRLLATTPALLLETWVADRFFSEITHDASGGVPPLPNAAAAYALASIFPAGFAL